MSADRLEWLSREYDRLDTEHLTLIRVGADRAALAASARAVSAAADAFNAEAYRKYHAREEDAWMSLDLLTERTEVLKELWQDMASPTQGPYRAASQCRPPTQTPRFQNEARAPRRRGSRCCRTVPAGERLRARSANAVAKQILLGNIRAFSTTVASEGSSTMTSTGLAVRKGASR